jgi:energy-coupling factor transport system ATP-binding protein
VLEARDVWFWYERGKPVLRGVGVEVREGEVLALMGRNGSGKTTLAKILSGLLKPRTGHVRRAGGHPVYIPEDPDVFFVSARPIDEVSASVARSGLNVDPLGLLDELGLSRYSEAPVYSLSLGVKKLVALAAAMPLASLALIVDEPTVGLDPHYSILLARSLLRLADSGVPVIIVTHDEEFVRLVADRVVVLRDGVLVYDGDPEGARVS